MLLDDDFLAYDALGLAELVRHAHVTAAELLETVVERIERVNPALNFVATRCYDTGRAMASERLPDGPFRGVPYLLKDAFTDWAGVRTTYGNVFFREHVPDHDSITVARAKDAGFVLVARTTTPDWGWALATETDLHGITRNPWNSDHTPGGSSGGGAAAVAARVLPIANASDAGGSIRVPASFCGLVGLKPSRGRVPLGPDMLDPTCGCSTEACVSLTVRDTAAYLDALGGALPGDPYALAPEPDTLLERSGRAPGKLRIGYTTSPPDGCELVDDEVRDGVETAARLCEHLGHDVEEIRLRYEHFPVFAAYRRMISVLYAGVVDGAAELVGREPHAGDFMEFVLASAREGRSVSGVQHAADIEMLRKGGRQIATQCGEYDVLVCPTVSVLPPRHGYLHMNETPLDEYWDTLTRELMVFTSPFNISGQPAVSLPLHVSAGGLPIGVQFVGPVGGDSTLLSLAAQIEDAAPWRDRLPPVHA